MNAGAVFRCDSRQAFRWLVRAVALVVAGACLLTSPALATPVSYTAGHADIGLTYNSAVPSFEMVYRFGGTALPASLQNTTASPADIVTIVPDNRSGASQNSDLRPAGSQWDFLGVAAGERIWYISTNNLAGVPYLGVSAEGLGPSTNWQGVNPAIQFSIVDVLQKPQPSSVVSAWTTGPLNVLWSTDTVPTTNNMTVFVGSHAHYNIGFSHQGTYQVQLQATGTLAGGQVVTSAPTTYTFQVVPEPSGLVGVGIGVIACAALARRRLRWAVTLPR